MAQEEQSVTPVPSIRKTHFETKVLPMLQYIGIIGAVLMGIAYLVIVMVMIVGFKVQNVNQTIVFSVVNALIGLIILQFLKIQGISFAKSLPENKEIIDLYFSSKTKDKKYKNINTYWFQSVFKDIIVKATSIAVSTAGIIYIVVQGSNDYNLLLLAIVNLVMFICFGLLSLNASYEFYNTRHVPYMYEQIRIAKELKEEGGE